MPNVHVVATIQFDATDEVDAASLMNTWRLHDGVDVAAVVHTRYEGTVDEDGRIELTQPQPQPQPAPVPDNDPFHPGLIDDVDPEPPL